MSMRIEVKGFNAWTLNRLVYSVNSIIKMSFRVIDLLGYFDLESLYVRINKFDRPTDGPTDRRMDRHDLL